MPATRRNFWAMKFLKNKQRDRAARRKLRRANWKVLVVWECHTRDLEKLTKNLVRFLSVHS
jgi:DNA mismatch endonuclease (patch repair protein)